MMNLQKNESGYVLVGVLLIFTIVSVLGLSIVMSSLTSVKTSHSERDNQSAYYIAEAGLTHYMADIESDVNDLYENSNNKNDFFNKVNKAIYKVANEQIYKEFEQVSGEKPEAEIKIKQLSNEKSLKYKMISTGWIGNNKRIVEQEFSVPWIDNNKNLNLPKLAIFANNKIHINGGKIIGDIHSTDENVKKGGNLTHKGNVKKDIDAKFPADYNFPSPPNEEIKKINNDSPIEWVDNIAYYENFNVEDDILTIPTGDTNKELFIKNLNLKKANILIEGEGKLTIYITGSMNLRGNKSSINKEGTVSQLDIFYYPKDPDFFINDLDITGLIFAPKAHVKFNDGEVVGMIVAKSLKMTGGKLTYEKRLLSENTGNEGGSGSTSKPVLEKGPLREQ